jgi:aerobic-type carbon monoxide dehydrogenase small subunit (CoxS/CutS family)
VKKQQGNAVSKFPIKQVLRAMRVFKYDEGHIRILTEIPMAKVTELHVNGTKHKVDADPDQSLLSVLRDDLDLTGTKYGCGEGQCGACTVLIDGKAVRSCITIMADVAGKQITTIEGLEKNGKLHPVQQAFLEHDAMQCGYCTTGMIMAGVGLLAQKAKPTRDDILHGMEGNICRCGTQPRIVLAIEMAARLGGGR